MPSRSSTLRADPAPDPIVAAGAILDVMPAVMTALRAAMRRQLGEGLSVPQFRCLRYIADNAGASVSEVAAFLGVTLATASAMVDRLVRAGYVLSGISARDRRRSELEATGSGRALMRRVRRGAQGELAEAMVPSTAAELAAVLDGLVVLQARFDHGR